LDNYWIYGSDAATRKFQAFNKKFYMPNNAVLVVAGDFKTEEAKQWIKNTLVISKRTCYRKDKLFGRANN
jgi:predicted Zn-dependent peptidase